MLEYTSLNEYVRQRFGGKVYKLCLDAGCTCPNRDGTLGTRGCIFCSEGGSGEFAAGRQYTIKEQLALAKKRVARKMDGEPPRYIAYFQAFTNTYGPVERLRELFLQALEPKEIVALSIATRPDCLGKEVLALLSECNRIKPVWVELGLQTIHEETARYIRRGYPLSVYDTAVRELRAIGVEVVVHLILGLPGETKEDMLASVRYVGASGVQGVKLQLLHILKGTDLAFEYEKGNVPVMELDEYARLVTECVAALPKDVVIHRLTGDGDKRLLLAPMWSADKWRVLNAIQREMRAYTE